MTSRQKSVCLITGGYVEKNLRLQPWRYLSEVAERLAAQGHPVTVISDAAPGTPPALAGAPVDRTPTIHRIPTVNRFRWQQNRPLQAALQEIEPDVVLWHLGLPSFVHQRLDGWPDVPVVGIYPGLVYRPQELLRLGIRKLARGYRLSAIHVLGTLVPKRFIRRSLGRGALTRLVAQTQATGQRLLETGLSPQQVTVIPPGVDEQWYQFAANGQGNVREQLGYTDADTVVLYFGSPAPLRGLHTLLRAFGMARRQDASFKLLILNRRRTDELLREDAELRRLLSHSDVGQHVQVVSGFLAPDVLTQHVAASDLVALPFELVPADAPLSLLEAQALGKPVITTNVASLPELVAPGIHYLAEPADPVSLACALQQGMADLRTHRNGRRPHDVASRRPTTRSWQQVGKEWSRLVQTL